MIPGATLPKLAECRTCHEPIRFVRMDATGRNMPVNPKPHTADSQGTVCARLTGPSLAGYVLTLSHPGDDRHPYRFTPHYATCDKPTTQAPPTEPEQALF